MGLNDNILEEIKSRCNIVDVIGRHVSLKKTGTNHKGLCPFHNEKTPSFVVSEDKQIFTCFGCGATGDVIEFTQRYNNLDFHGAVEKLADECGIDLGQTSFAAEGNKAKLYEINREAAAFFYRSFTKKANAGYDYMNKRGIMPETLRKFGVGYADSDWQSLYNFFSEKGTDENLLMKLGLISKSKDKYYDKFRERVMFPIINTRGKVIGFGGRTVGDGTPKYLNSPESAIFYKKNNLFGLNLTREDINRENCAILVEGYMDVISLYQHGIRNVSASLGTALTENQAAMLKRYTENIVLAYDSDEAGQAATMRGIDILRSAGCKIKILRISDGKDPDDFIKNKGKEAFLELVREAIPFPDYKIGLLKKKFDVNTMQGSVGFLQEAAKIIKSLSPVEADAYIKKIAGQAKISEGALRMEVYGNMHREPAAHITSRKQVTAADRLSVKKSSEFLLEKYLIKLMLVKSAYILKISPYADAFKNPAYFRIYEIIKSLYRDDEEIDIKKVFDSLDEEGRRLLKDIIENIQFADKDSEVFDDCISHINSMSRVKREDEIIKLLSVLDDEKDKDKIFALTQELMQIQREKIGEKIRNEL